jgi:arabinogalactan oligomer/maltooligosaccharide transport system permease protein
LSLFANIRRNRLAYLLILPTALVMAGIVFYPLIRGVLISFTDMNQYNMGSRFVPASYRFVWLSNFAKVLASSEFWDILGQTVIWTVTNVFFHFTIGLALALLLNRRMRGRALYRMLLLVPWAVPTYISAFSWRWLFNSKYGFFNLALRALGADPIPWLSHEVWAMVAVIATNVWLGFPFMMVVLLGGLQSIPRELYEASEVDGCGRVGQFRNITLPLLKPVALTATLLGIIWTFNMFNVIYLVTEGGPHHQTDILATFAFIEAFHQWRFGLATTYAVIILSILLSFSFLYIRALRGTEEIY